MHARVQLPMLRDDPGPVVYAKAPPPAPIKLVGTSKREVIRKRQNEAAAKAINFAHSLGPASWLCNDLRTGRVSSLEAEISVTKGALKGPTIEGHLRVLRRFEDWCKANGRNPWNSSKGSGPRIRDINDWASHVYRELDKANKDLPQDERIGKTVINCFPRAFRCASACLGLKCPIEHMGFLERVRY